MSILDGIYFRNAVMQRIRAFFYARDFVEVETPIRIPSPCMELHIEAEPSGECFLRTSPELFHKRLIAAGMSRIFEVGKCFRRGEFGAWHHPEYTMLEWYRTETDYRGVLDDTLDLLKAVWAECPAQVEVLTVEEAFQRWAGWNPVTAYHADRFDLDLVEQVEPALKKRGGLVVLKDYPLEAAALARISPSDNRVAERWELYLNGVELANAYSELTDPVEQRIRFEQCAEEKEQLGLPVYEMDESFLKVLEKMPPTGGVALGVDRLLMCMRNEAGLDAVLPFRTSEI